MGVGSLGIPEDGVRQPNQSHHVAVQSQFLHRAVVSEAAVRPRLGEDDVDLVFLKEENHQQTFQTLPVSFRKTTKFQLCVVSSDIKRQTLAEWNVPLAEILTGLL